jgi:RNA polymerase sigma factor (sigma-70 family)
MSHTDLELLARYTRFHAEDAFSEVVRRHLDLVHSAALRQVRSPQLAEEVAQSTFIKLAGHAHRLAPSTILTAWLYQVTRREAIDVVRREARRQLREHVALQMNAMNATADDWTQIEPLLDEAMHALDETDRTAVLLRYFENKSLREVGETLGTTDDTARKRVNRAVEHLREFFTKRGVTVGGSGLVLLISTNAVLVAPSGLSAAITASALAAVTTAALTGTTVGTMSWFNAKSGAVIVAAALIVGLTVYLLDRHRLAENEEGARIARAQQQQMALARDEALAAARASQQQVEALRRDLNELPRLQGEVARLRNRIALSQVRNDATNAEPPLSAEELRTLLGDIGDHIPHDVMYTRSFRAHLPSKGTNALATLRARGASPVPRLLELLGTENKDGEDVTMTTITTEATLFHDQGRFQRTLALQGFYALGPKAAPAIPALLRFRATIPDDDAAYALAGIAYAPVTPLVDAMSSPDQAIRRRAMLALGLMQAKEPAVNDALIACLSDPEENPEQRLVALFALGRTGPDPEQVFPALQEALRDPKLTSLTNHVVRERGDVVQGFCTAFEQCRPLTKAAVPQMLESLPSLKGREAQVVKEVLKRIDPQAAAEAGNQ